MQDNRYPTVTPPWQILSDDERASLSNLVQGREMPYPADPSAPLGTAANALTADEMDTISTWIEQGAVIPANGCGQ